MRNGRAGGYEFTVRLDDPNELFEERRPDVMRGRPPEPAGIDQIRNVVADRPRDAAGTVYVVLPADKVTPDVEIGVRRAVARYCEAGVDHVTHELAAVRRDGSRTFLFGAIVLAIGLALSEFVLKSHLPKEIRDFFGNGLFVVVAWVGLWYPLDTLLYSGIPHRNERRALNAIANLEIVVQSEGGHDSPAGDVGEAPAEPVGGQSLTGG